jgi:Protein of unknown function (DUF3726)
VIALSLGEAASLAAKVGRGAGFSWGLAEEIGRGARLLARGGLPWADALLALAEKAGGLQAPSPPQAECWRQRQSEPGSPALLCPVRVAALLIDDPAILQTGPLHLQNVGVPIWIAGLVAASCAAGGFTIAWADVLALATRQGVWPRGQGGTWLAPAAAVEISPGGAALASPPPLRRALADAAVLTALEDFAARVYVPTSENSRARGAGGGSVDEE